MDLREGNILCAKIFQEKSHKIPGKVLDSCAIEYALCFHGLQADMCNRKLYWVRVARNATRKAAAAA